MRISAKADYAIRALVVLAQVEDGSALRSEAIATRQGISHGFLESIMAELRRTGFVAGQRGADGGFRLRRAAADIQVAQVIRAIDGPLSTVRGECPEDVTYQDRTASLQLVWIAMRASLRNVLEAVSIADVAAGQLPESVVQLTKAPDAWHTKGMLRAK